MKRQLDIVNKKSKFVPIDLLTFVQINIDLSIFTVDDLLKQLTEIATDDIDKVLKVVIKGTKTQIQMFNVKNAKQRIKEYTEFLDVVFSFDIIKEQVVRDTEMIKEERPITLLEKYLRINGIDEDIVNRVFLKGKQYLEAASILR